MQRTSWSGLVFALSLLAPAFAQNAEPAVDQKQLRNTAQAAVRSGDSATAIASFKKLTEIDPKDAQAWHMLGYSLHMAGKLDEALPVHKKAAEFPATAPVATYNVACVYALQGKTDEAFAWLDKAIAVGFDQTDQLEIDTDMDSLRKDPRFEKVQKAMAAAGDSKPNKVQVFAQTVERKLARVAWFDKKGSPGQIAIDYSPVQWQEKYDDAVAKMVGKKWRFGADCWTSLDTSVPLQIGGVEVPAGYYYLTLEQRDPGAFLLALHDANEVKKQRIDPFQADRLKSVGIEVKLEHGKAEKQFDRLDVGIHVEKGSLDHGTFAVYFGGHALTAPVAMQVGK